MRIWYWLKNLLIACMLSKLVAFRIECSIPFADRSASLPFSPVHSHLARCEICRSMCADYEVSTTTALYIRHRVCRPSIQFSFLSKLTTLLPLHIPLKTSTSFAQNANIDESSLGCAQYSPSIGFLCRHSPKLGRILW